MGVVLPHLLLALETLVVHPFFNNQTQYLVDVIENFVNASRNHVVERHLLQHLPWEVREVVISKLKRNNFLRKLVRLVEGCSLRPARSGRRRKNRYKKLWKSIGFPAMLVVVREEVVDGRSGCNSRVEIVVTMSHRKGALLGMMKVLLDLEMDPRLQEGGRRERRN
jgi:hypothetical protein